MSLEFSSALNDRLFSFLKKFFRQLSSSVNEMEILNQNPIFFTQYHVYKQMSFPSQHKIREET